MRNRLIIALVALATLVSLPAHADGLAGDGTDPVWWSQQIDRAGPKPAKPGREWWRAVVAKHGSCRVLNDGCRNCFVGKDSFTCSNPGIACIANDTWTCAASIGAALGPR